MKAILRMAWRETRATPGRYLFFLLAVAVGVAALVGVKGFGVSLQMAIFREARQLMAGDVQASTSKPPAPEHLAVLSELGRQGIRTTKVTELISMAAVPGGQETALVELKGYEPGGYPFYGQLLTEPAGAGATLAADAVLVGSDLLERTGLQVGDSLQLGRGTYRIAGIVRREPDRVATGFSLGPRVLITQSGLERSELVVPGSRARHAFLLKLPDTLTAGQVKSALANRLGEDWRVRDYLEAQPQVTRAIGRMVSFLSLVSLVALVAGGLGVAHTTRAFLQQKLDTVAILKCLGANSRTVIGIYLMQALGLGLAGSVLGAAVGFGVQAAMPGIIGPLLNLDVPLAPSAGPIWQGLAVGTLMAALFSLVPLMSIARVPPALVFRRDLAENERGGTHISRDEALAAGVAAVALGLVAAWQAGNWLWGLYFFGGLSGAAALLGGSAWVSLKLVRRAPRARRLEVRHGLLNLYRPGSHAGSVVLALGLGVTAVATVYLLQTGLLSQFTSGAPTDAPNLVMIGIQREQAGAFAGFLGQHPAVRRGQSLQPLVQAQLLTVDGRGPDDPVPGMPAPAGADTGRAGTAGGPPGGGPGGGRGGERGSDGDWSSQRGFWNRTWTLTWSDAVPERNELISGRWWTATEASSGHYVSVEEEAARRLGAKVGSAIVFEIDGQRVAAKAMSIRRVDWARISTNFLIVFSQGALDGFNANFTTFVWTDRAQQANLLRTMVDRFPGVTAFDIGDILETVQSVMNQLGLVVRFVAAFAIAAGLIILAGGVAATRFRRVREAAIMRTLGASRRTVALAMAVEYAVLGAVAGLVGIVLAHLVTAGVMEFLLELRPTVNWALIALAPALCALLTVLTGTLAAWDVLNLKPLAVLRGE